MLVHIQESQEGLLKLMVQGQVRKHTFIKYFLKLFMPFVLSLQQNLGICTQQVNEKEHHVQP